MIPTPSPPGDAKQSDYTRRRLQYWDDFADSLDRWRGRRAYYQRRLAELYRHHVPPGMRVLELGCGEGDLLAAVQPAYGLGIDLSPKMIARARTRHPHLEFRAADAHWLDLDAQFDYILCSDLVNDLWDVQQVLQRAARHCHPATRLVLNSYNHLWELPRSFAETLRIAKPLLTQNWLTGADVRNLLYLSGFEVIRLSSEILWPLRTPVLQTLANKYVVKLWPFHWFALTNLIVARPQPRPAAGSEPVVSVIVPARNEAGNIAQIFDRTPQMGAGTELIFVEGHSTDATYQAIEREMAARPNARAKLLRQTGEGKGDAVRAGFAVATGEVLTILDADLTVAPEDLPRFYDAWRSGQADFVNGVRLVYPMEDAAMRFFNHIGNRFFSLAFTWLLGQSVKDTLCGTKLLSKRDYEVIAANRAWFGSIDPFGDFDLLFGAARYDCKIVDMPVRYRERTYGKTNIHRWRHGALLLRMLLRAMRRLKFV